jgi:L-glyceraldehyde 3-phosphate reductase
VTKERLDKIRQLNVIAQQRGQTLAQMALAWNLRHSQVTSVLVGASRVEQIEENVGALDVLDLSQQELDTIDTILSG